MNNKLIPSLGLLALLFAGSVAALPLVNVQASVNTTAAVDAAPVSVRNDTSADAFIELQSIRARVWANAQDRSDFIDDWTARVRAMNADERAELIQRAALVRARILAHHQGQLGVDSFQGQVLDRMLDATDFTAEEKLAFKEELRAYKALNASQGSERHSFMMVSILDGFTATGKYSIASNQDDYEGGVFTGFSNVTEKRFVGIFLNGKVLGMSDGHMFWGTYGLDENEVPRFEFHNFGTEAHIDGHYFVYA